MTSLMTIISPYSPNYKQCYSFDPYDCEDIYPEQPH